MLLVYLHKLFYILPKLDKNFCISFNLKEYIFRSIKLFLLILPIKIAPIVTPLL